MVKVYLLQSFFVLTLLCTCSSNPSNDKNLLAIINQQNKEAYKLLHHKKPMMYDTVHDNVLTKPLSELIDMLHVSLKKNKKVVKKMKFNYFDFSIFAPRHDTTAWHTDYVEVGYDKQGNILEIFSYGDKDGKYLPKKAMNVNYYVYHYDRQYLFMVVNQSGDAGYYAHKTENIDDDKPQPVVDKNIIIIVYDKLYRTAIYLNTHEYMNILQNKQSNCYFINHLGILDDNLFTKHSFGIGENSVKKGAAQFIIYIKYSSKPDENKYLFHHYSNNKKTIFFCYISLSMKEVLRQIPIWETEYNAKNDEEKVPWKFKEHIKYNLHLPAWLHDYR